MPAHNWKRIYDGTFHHVHQYWIGHLSARLNAGLLPPDYYAMAEQRGGTIIPDVITLKVDEFEFSNSGGGTAVLAPPNAAVKTTFDVLAYVNRQNSIVIHHISDEKIVAVFEIVSRGNKAGSDNFDTFLEKANGCVDRGVHFSFVDVHTPGNLDPHGVHGAICLSRAADPPELPAGKVLSSAGYEAGSILKAYVNPFGIGDSIPDVALFLRRNFYVMLPLEETYIQAFASLPKHLQKQIEQNTN